MPHDCKGRKIEIGDFVLAKPYNYGVIDPVTKEQRRVVGRVVVMREGQTCSGEFVWLRPWHGNAQDSFGADEAELILKNDGTKPDESL